MALDQNLLKSSGKLVSLIRERLHNALSVYAFGSQLNGTASAQSDLDLAVLVGGYVPPLVLWELGRDLEALVPCAVDLLDLRAASTVMQYQVITTGKSLWALDVQAGLFECYVLSEKIALDSARSGLLQDISESGTVYAR